MIPSQQRWFVGAGLASLALFGTAPVRADSRADALLKEVATASKAVKTLTADVAISVVSSGNETKATGKVRLMKPNFASIDVGAPFHQLVASDGKKLYTLKTDDNQYLPIRPVDPKGAGLSFLDLGEGISFLKPVSVFFDAKAALSLGQPGATELTTRYVGKETVEGKEYEVVELKREKSQEKPQQILTKLYINSTKLVVRTLLEVNFNDQTMKVDTALKNIKTDTVMTAANFAYKLPKNAVAYQEPSQDEFEKKLVAVGKDAPTFSVPTLSGGEMTLYEAAKNKKAILVNFWFYN